MVGSDGLAAAVRADGVRGADGCGWVAAVVSAAGNLLLVLLLLPNLLPRVPPLRLPDSWCEV